MKELVLLENNDDKDHKQTAVTQHSITTVLYTGIKISYQANMEIIATIQRNQNMISCIMAK